MAGRIRPYAPAGPGPETKVQAAEIPQREQGKRDGCCFRLSLEINKKRQNQGKLTEGFFTGEGLDPAAAIHPPAGETLFIINMPVNFNFQLSE